MTETIENQVADTTAVRTQRSRTIRTTTLVTHLALITIIVSAWWLVSTQSRYIVSPLRTVAALKRGLTEEGVLGAAGATLKAALVGFAIAVMVGAALGYLLATRRFLGEVFVPMVQAYGSVPHIIFLPILLSAFGIGNSAKVAMAVLVAIFPVVINVYAGVRSVQQNWVKLGRLLRLGPVRIALRIYLRASVPSLIVGMRLAFGAAFLAVVISEFFGSDSGLGVAMAQAYAALDYERLFVIVVVTLVVALVANAVFRFLDEWLSFEQ